MLPSTCVVVPTYWTRAGGQPRESDAVYDHPTAVDGPETLSTLMESLARLRTSSFYVLILVGVTDEEIGKAAETRVRAIAERFPSLLSLVFGQADLAAVYSCLADAGIGSSDRYLRLRDYPTIRNLQLVIPTALHSESIVALDDDEVVTDERFIDKAVEPLGTIIDGRRVDGLSGHYLQADGGILLKVDAAKAGSPNIFDRKAAIMNRATEELEAQPGTIVETPFCFGGNMEFSAELAATVGFDPEITRGEDIDYLINARMEGKHFFLRKDLRILHCPPSGGSYRDASRVKLEQDIQRFLYEQEKLRVSQEMPDLQPVLAEDLDNYPGEFLCADLVGDAVDALERAGFEADPREFVHGAQTEASAKMRRYLEFRRCWPSIQETVARDDALRALLASKVNGA
jgi:hypothetical protein